MRIDYENKVIQFKYVELRKRNLNLDPDGNVLVRSGISAGLMRFPKEIREAIKADRESRKER